MDVEEEVQVTTTVQSTHNEQVDIVTGEHAKEPVSLALMSPTEDEASGSLLPHYRFMNDSLAATFASRTSHFEALSGIILQEHNFDSAFPVDNYIQEEVAVVGKVALDERDGARELMLHSVHADAPTHALLNLSALASYSVFPGQVLALKGTNPQGREFRATALYEPSMLPTPPATKRVVRSGAHESVVLAAAGPFTASSDLDYLPLQKVLKHAANVKPDLLLLIGPLVDSNHSFIRSGEIDVTYQELYEEQCERVEEFLSAHPTVSVALVPSLRDIHHRYHVFPQPSFEYPRTAIPNRLFLMSNPCDWWMDGHTKFGVLAEDVLRHLSAAEIGKRDGSETDDRMTRLLKLMLKQRAFYPLEPAAPGVNIDTTHIERNRFSDELPDVLFLCSELKPFVKEVEGVLVVNVGRASKGKYGTLAHISMRMPQEEISDNAQVRAARRVDLLRME
eukprot:TRINITY_DN18641_c0_g1_i1.p1 TRINITY_DN18641_c0_g1~~TRINITY_DN18641_c0_g1_i1.p1  ORF type:complete len:450 (-),score=125.14 TRINITY_DN18641_c0_g1_i1:112-1461(-)